MQVAYLKLELSVLLKPAKELRLPPMLFVLERVLINSTCPPRPESERNTAAAK